MEVKKKCFIFAHKLLTTMEQSKKEELIKDLDIYLRKFDCVNPKSRGNYLSWTRYLMNKYHIEEIETIEDVNDILYTEKALQKMEDRTKYKTQRDLSNFRSTLNRLLPFINMWRMKQEKLAIMHSYDEMICQIEQQACLEHAIMMYNAIVFQAFQNGYVMTESQKLAMKKALAKFECKINADKLFMPNSSYNLITPSAI